MRLRGGPHDHHRLLIAAPLFHERARRRARLAAGATVVLLPQFERAYIEAIERFGCTWLTAVPPMLAMMPGGRAPRCHRRVERYDPHGLGPGERPAAFPDQGGFPNARVLNVYGTTEAGPVVFGPDPQGRPKPDAALGGRNPVWS